MLHLRHNPCTIVHPLYIVRRLSTVISIGYKNFVDFLALVQYNTRSVAGTLSKEVTSKAYKK